MSVKIFLYMIVVYSPELGWYDRIQGTPLMTEAKCEEMKDDLNRYMPDGVKVICMATEQTVIMKNGGKGVTKY